MLQFAQHRKNSTLFNSPAACGKMGEAWRLRTSSKSWILPNLTSKAGPKLPLQSESRKVCHDRLGQLGFKASVRNWFWDPDRGLHRSVGCTRIPYKVTVLAPMSEEFNIRNLSQSFPCLAISLEAADKVSPHDITP